MMTSDYRELCATSEKKEADALHQTENLLGLELLASANLSADVKSVNSVKSVSDAGLINKFAVQAE